jgi:hypothetical protein
VKCFRATPLLPGSNWNCYVTNYNISLEHKDSASYSFRAGKREVRTNRRRVSENEKSKEKLEPLYLGERKKHHFVKRFPVLFLSSLL